MREGTDPLERLERGGRGEPVLLLEFTPKSVASEGGVVGKRPVFVDASSPFSLTTPSLPDRAALDFLSMPLGVPEGFGMRSVRPPLELTVAGFEGDGGYDKDSANLLKRS